MTADVMRCAIWYHLYNLKLKNIHGGVLILVKLKALACNFTKINTPPWVFFTFFKLYKWYQIAQRTANNVTVTTESYQELYKPFQTNVQLHYSLKTSKILVLWWFFFGFFFYPFVFWLFGCLVFKNTYFYRKSPVAASQDQKTYCPCCYHPIKMPVTPYLPSLTVLSVLFLTLCLLSQVVCY